MSTKSLSDMISQFDIKSITKIATLLFPLTVLSQAYEPDACDASNPELKQLVNGGTIPSLYLHGCGPGWTDVISSSYLKASGKPPSKPESPESDSELLEEWEDYRYAYDLWTCKYSAYNLSDENTSTALVEGVEGNGIGEIVIVSSLDLSRPIEIWNGYGKSANLFKYNSRVKTLNVHVITAQREGATQCGTFFKNARKVKSFSVSLKDYNGYQALDVPELGTYGNESKEVGTPFWIAIEITDVYKGEKWADTCISEIRNIR